MFFLEGICPACCTLHLPLPPRPHPALPLHLCSPCACPRLVVVLVFLVFVILVVVVLVVVFLVVIFLVLFVVVLLLLVAHVSRARFLVTFSALRHTRWFWAVSRGLLVPLDFCLEDARHLSTQTFSSSSCTMYSLTQALSTSSLDTRFVIPAW